MKLDLHKVIYHFLQRYHKLVNHLFALQSDVKGEIQMIEIYWMVYLGRLIPLYVDMALRRVYRPSFALCLTRRNYIHLMGHCIFCILGRRWSFVGFIIGTINAQLFISFRRLSLSEPRIESS